MDRVNEGTFQLEDLAQGFRDIEQCDELYENLFEDIDLYSKKLGSTPQKQNQLVAAVMKELAVLEVAGHAGDMLGDAYEYLIGQFATDSGKKAGEFYTPQPVAKLMTQIAFLGREDGPPWDQAPSCSMPRNFLTSLKPSSTLVRSSIPRPIT